MMKPERWRQVDQLFQAALERAPEERAAFISEACGGDDSLRREVEALLAADGEAESFIEAPAYAVAAPLIVGGDTQSLAGKSIGHYRIISLLGKGGMGEVYRAEDTHLRREVAIKVLPDDFAKDDHRLRRFEQEARAASALNHPNIITIHEIGEAEGARYIVTEHVAGETLRQRLTRLPRQKMEPKEAVEIAMQIATALTAAHEAGITHRDIKPENVMVRPDGLVKVLDFGLAKLTERPAAAPEADSQAEAIARQSTEPGMVMGTASYMSPEQARGQKVDHRTDIFSLGVVLYEMIAGRRPFEGATMSDVIAALLTAEPPPLGQYCAEASVELERIVGKCLAKDREARYQSAAELIVELKTLSPGSQSGGATTHRVEGTRPRLASWLWLLISATALLLVVGLVWFLSWRRAPAVQPDQIKSLAVLPLENLSGDPAQEYFADGMTEALISNLTQVRALRVISRTSVMRFKGSRKPLAEIARELNVDAVIEGSVQRDGGRVKITARLIRVVNETPLRSFDYERELADVLKLQSDVARAVANEIQIQVTAEERARLASARRVNPEAHEAYLLGRYYMRRQHEADLKLAIGHFERAIQLDASYAAAWAGLSVAWLQRGIWGATPFRDVEPPARQAAVKALEFDAGSAEAYTSLAMLKHRYNWDWAGSEHDFRHAIELDPGSVEAHRFFAFLLTALGRHTEAISEIQTAEQLDPLSSLVQSDFGSNLYFARNHEQAERHLKRALELDPLNYGVWGRLGNVYVEMGRYADAIASLEKAKAMWSDNRRKRVAATGLAFAYARMGRQEEALRMFKELQRTTDPEPVRGTVAVWAALGNKDEAFRLLFDAVEKRADLLIFTKVDPPFDSLHSDPRWKELLRPMNFPEK
ncbi:MAG: protein kinase domain-containing protein [Blastocatellia bacterium]